MSAAPELSDLFAEIRALGGVRGVILTTGHGTIAANEHAGFDGDVARDMARAIRRMALASSSAAAPLEELIVNLGAVRVLVVPITEEATLAALVDHDADLAPLRDFLRVQHAALRDAAGRSERSTPAGPAPRSGDGEIATLMASDLGPTLRAVEAVLTKHLRNPGQASTIVRHQVGQWLQCCKPEPYTLPLLLDGICEALAANPEIRDAFVVDVRRALTVAMHLRTGAPT